jgi:hypothetical protein
MLIDELLPHAIVARCVVFCRDERGAEVVAGPCRGFGNVEAPGNCQLLDFLVRDWSRAVVEGDKQRERKLGSKGARTNAKQWPCA